MSERTNFTFTLFFLLLTDWKKGGLEPEGVTVAVLDKVVELTAALTFCVAVPVTADERCTPFTVTP